MLSKLLLILSVLALGAASYFGFQNRDKFKTTRLEKDSLLKQIKVIENETDALIKDNDAKIAQITAADGTKQQKNVALQGATSARKSKEAELANINKEITDSQAELTKLTDELNRILDGKTVDEMAQTVETLSKEVDTLKTDKETQNKELDLHTKELADAKSQLAAKQKSDADRSRGIALNSTEGTVVATNQDYGFAVVNIGKNKGVTADSKLIVMRDGQRIGQLSITSIEANRTVGDIVQKSLAGGQSVAPGDRVIFEKVQR